MKQEISQIALLVADYDEALEFYTQKLQFRLLEDTHLDEHKRWVRISPAGDSAFALLLAKAANDEQMKFVGNQSGGRVFLFLKTDDFEKDRQNLIKHGVKIIREPVLESWGKVLVFADLYGNLWDLIG
ncbi:MAG: VOC family protein [Saprospiraceae bacterium]